MTDKSLPTTYRDLLEEEDGPALFTVIRTMEQVYPRVQPPAGLMDRIRASEVTMPLVGTPRRRHSWISKPFASVHRPVRRSASLALAVALAIGALGGAGYAMHVLGGIAHPHVVLSCSDFGARWTLAGAGARMMSPQEFAASGGRLIPHWRQQVSSLQRPQYWATPTDAHVVDTCRGSSSSQVEIGTNQPAHTQLSAISVVPIWESNRPWLVGGLRIPPRGGCAPKPTTSPVRAPDGRAVAQLAQVPAILSRSVKVTLPPCMVSKRPVRNPMPLPPSKEVSFRVLSQVPYQGSAGVVVVLAARPSPAALRPGLDLGNPAGRLLGGRRVWNVHCAGHGCPLNDLRWMQRGLIVSISGDLSVNRLKALAADVVLR